MVTLAAEESFKHADWRDEGKEENNNKNQEFQILV